MNHRRFFLQSATAIITLPVLESLGFRRFAAAAEPARPPKRLIFLGFGWGITESTWYPDIKKPGPNYELPPGLKPLARTRLISASCKDSGTSIPTRGTGGARCGSPRQPLRPARPEFSQ